MSLPSKTQAAFVADVVSGWAAYLGFQPALQKGDALLALMESVAGQLVFIQAQIQIVNDLARAQTSTGADLDAWMAQFGFVRLPATFNSGPVTFGKYQPAASPITIPAGTVVQTPGGAIQYTVVADPAQPTWNAAANGYILAIGQTSLTATVQATVAGSSTNVSIGQISQIASSIAGIDTVTNGASISNALNAESDSDFRTRFVGWFSSLAKATYAAIVSTIQGVQQGIQFTLQENVDTGGNPRPGEFVATIDDGSGSPPASLVNAVETALMAVRGFTILPETVAVDVVNVTVSLAVRVASGYTAVNVQAAVEIAVTNAVNALLLGASPLFIGYIEDAAKTVPGALSCQPGATLINGTNADFAFTKFQAARTVVSSVTCGTY